jgi:hypothetical protein
MPYQEPLEAHSPEPENKPPEVVGMHVTKKYGKFHGHLEMADGSMHKMAPHASMPEAHQALGEHMAAFGQHEEEPEPMPVEERYHAAVSGIKAKG